jgi:SOS-response transcriptional repressor LexA
MTTVLPFPYAKESWHMAVIEKIDSLGKLLKQRRDDLEGSANEVKQEDVAAAVGVVQSYISKLERGALDKTIPKWKGDRVWKLLKAYKFDDNEVFGVIKRFDLDFPPRQPRLANFQTDQPVALTREVMVYAAGTGPAWDLDDVLEIVFVPGDLYPNHDLLGLKAMSRSMEPYLPKGAIAVVVLDDGFCKEGDYCGIRIHGDGVVIKRYVKDLGNGELLLESLNPDPNEESFFVAPLGSRVMGKVVKRLLDG